MVRATSRTVVLLLLATACGDRALGGGGSGDSSSEGGDPSGPLTANTTRDDSGPVTATLTDPSTTLTDSGPVDSGPIDTGCIPRQCGVEIACGTADDGCGTPLECGPCAEGTPVDGIIARRMIADRSRGTLLATVDATSAMHPNELVVIDPSSATITTSVFVGSDPTSLAISDDGSTVWVSLEGSQEIREVMLGDTPIAGESYGLPPSDLPGAVAGPMVVLPGTVDSVAVSMHAWGYSPSFTGLAVFDAGVPRAVQTPGHTGAAKLTSGPSGWLYGFNDLHTGFGFYAVEVQASGPVATEFQGLVEGFGTDIVYADGLVFASDGAIVDVSDPAQPDLAGSFPYAGAVVPDVANGRVLMLSPPDFGESNVTVRELDIATFTQTGSAGIMTVTDIAVIDFAAPDDANLGILFGDYYAETRQLMVVPNPFP